MGAHGGVGNEPESPDYSVHEAWNEATNVYLLVILVSFGLLMYARKNKRKIMRIFTLPPTVGNSPEPNFYDSLQKVRLRQQLEMYSMARKFEQQQQQQQQGQADSVQLSME
ncbi:small integral membrane protein 19 [Solea solea]|uniref:small integral membrane protein 19 n=1 Tax=Solea solea TaxID=90069 RepID=UPI00272C20C4|nr:small integral membrane protein 19 [Solea solea]